jgi:DNA-binding HxlR family transcriptional regulator
MTLATVVYGARGSGKTTLGRVLAEEVTKAGQRFCAVEPKGDWWGLKSTADGTGEGIPVVVFGGDHADLPLEEGAGREIASIIADLDQSVIVDLENLSKGKQLKFLAPFFERLYDANREPLLLLLDEAQRYAPQRPITPEATVCLGAVEDLVKLGRKHGIGPVLLTQRGSGLNKEVSELCDMLVAFRTPGPLDQERVREWLDANTTRDQRDQVMGAIAKLPTGTAVMASGHPALDLFGLYEVRRPETFDSSATPEIGRRRIEPKRLAKPEIEALRAKMAEAIERAKNDDPKELRARIRALEKALAAKVPKEKVVEIREIVERVEVPVLPPETKKALTDFTDRLGAMADKMQGWQRDIVLALDRREHGPVVKAVTPARVKAEAEFKAVKAAVASGALPVAPVRVNGDEATLTPYASRLLATMAQRHPMTLTRAQLALMSKSSARSSAFDAALALLRRLGMIEMDGGTYKIMQAGWEATPDGGPPPPPAPGELLNHWRSVLPPGPRLFLDTLVDADRPLTREELAERSGRSLTSSAFDAGIAMLRKMGLVEGDRSGLSLNADLR